MGYRERDVVEESRCLSPISFTPLNHPRMQEKKIRTCMHVERNSLFFFLLFLNKKKHRNMSSAAPSMKRKSPSPSKYTCNACKKNGTECKRQPGSRNPMCTECQSQNITCCYDTPMRSFTEFVQRLPRNIAGKSPAQPPPSGDMTTGPSHKRSSRQYQQDKSFLL
jgi:hypothetical protein